MTKGKPHATYLRKAAVAERYSISDRHVDRMVDKGAIPKPLYLNNSRVPLWNTRELDENDRKAAVRSRFT